MGSESSALQDMSALVDRLEIDPLLTSARTARSAGHTWSQIAKALGLSASTELLPGDVAFDLVKAMQNLRGGPFTWPCRDCGRDIADQDTHFLRQPIPGHAPGCPRLAGEIEDHTARRIWHRATVDHGGPAPRRGDRHLAALITLHAETFGSGTADSVGALTDEELKAAGAAAGYFGRDDLSGALTRLTTERPLDPDDQTAHALTTAYTASALPLGPLYSLFRQKHRTAPNDFAPLDPGDP